MSNENARDRVLETAEQLFTERGYAAVTLRDIADALGIRQASLYYHAPGGKAALFVESTQRALDRHHAGLQSAMSEAHGSLRAQLNAAARWLLAQPALNYGRMMRSDMPALDSESAAMLRIAAHRSLIAPLEAAFTPYADAPHVSYLAGAFLSIIEGIHNLPQHYSAVPKSAMADYLIGVLVRGMATESDEPRVISDEVREDFTTEAQRTQRNTERIGAVGED